MGEGTDQFAEDVQLELRGGGIADAYRRRALVAGEPRHLEFFEAALARQAVEHLQLSWRSGHRASDPVTPRACLVVVARVDEGGEHKGGIARPAEAVIPVARSADLLGQRSGGRR